MKLSKAQQSVVDKMREGWEYCKIGHDSPLLIFRLHQKNINGMSWGTFKALLKNGVIAEASNDGFTTTYRLADQYKTAPPVEGK